MELTNYTPFPAISWESGDQLNNRYLTTVCRAKFKLIPSETGDGSFKLSLDPEQGELFGSDVYIGADDQKELRYPSDYVAYKPNTDIILHAHSYSPNVLPRKSWECSVEIYNPINELLLEKKLRITGNRFWKRTLWGWKLDEPDECTDLPIRYKFAYGGKAELKNQETAIHDDYNDVGCGIVHKLHVDKVIQAPRIESIDFPIDANDPYVSYLPQGFGPIDKRSYYRLQYAGTYNDQWLEENHPMLPNDFNPLYNQSAHPDLIMSGYIPQQSTIKLRNLSLKYPVLFFPLPHYTFGARHIMNTRNTEKEMHIDTVIIDADNDDMMEWRVYLSWRSHYLMDETIQKSEIVLYT